MQIAAIEIKTDPEIKTLLEEDSIVMSDKMRIVEALGEGLTPHQTKDIAIWSTIDAIEIVKAIQEKIKEKYTIANLILKKQPNNYNKNCDWL